jgi:2-polyprenyl-3-methyl-5-hydroxy-6-metoxy-1,4-benzoquinol methylase
MNIADSQVYDNPRTDIRAHLKGRYVRALDVGCDVGTFANAIKRDGVVDLIDGVEISPAALQADKVLHAVYRVDLSHSQDGLPIQSYDLVLCLDVLEHMINPWHALVRIRSLMKDSGTLVVCLPNVRNFRVLVPLILNGRWDYADTGLLDRTHFRFFTLATMREMLLGAGYKIDSEISLSMSRYSKAWWLNLLTLGLLRGFLEHQYLFFCSPNR